MTWPTKKLGEVTDIYGGGTPRRSSPSYWGNDIPWLTMEDVNSNFEVTRTVQSISNQGLQNSNAQLVPVGSVNLSCTASVGNVTINRIPLATNQQFNSFHPHPGLLSKFLAYELIFRKREIETLGGITTFPFISKTTISNFSVHVPSLSTQQQIVERLDKIAEAQKLNDELIQKANGLFQSLLHRELNPAGKNWEIKKLETLVDTVKIGPFGSALKIAELSDAGPVRVLFIENVVNNEFEWAKEKYISEGKYKELKAYTVNANDILVTMMGTIGRTCIVPKNIGRAIISSHLIKITPDDKLAVTEYLNFSLHNPYVTDQIRRKAKGAIMKGLNSKILKSLDTPIPNIETQKQIVAKLLTMQEYKKQLLTQKSKLKELFESVLHKSMRGEKINV